MCMFGYMLWHLYGFMAVCFTAAQWVATGQWCHDFHHYPILVVLKEIAFSTHGGVLSINWLPHC